MSVRHRDTEIPQRTTNSGPSEPKRMKATDSDDPMASADASTCHKCASGAIGAIGGISSCFVLGCGPKCRVCANCFSQMVLRLAETKIMTCPCCDIAIDSWDAVYSRVHARRSGLTFVEDSSTFQVPIISSKLDPLRYHANMTSPEARDKLIGISVSSSNNGDVFSLSELFIHDSDCNEWGHAQLGLLEHLFKMLRVLLIASDSTRGRTDYDVSNATPEALRWFTANDFSPLHRMIHVLACGRTLADTKRIQSAVGVDGSTNWDRNVATTHAATDMIRHLSSDHSGIVKAACHRAGHEGTQTVSQCPERCLQDSQ
jgi:hypothetical protein